LDEEAYCQGSVSTRLYINGSCIRKALYAGVKVIQHNDIFACLKGISEDILELEMELTWE
jgi:hypothetical protein